MDNKLYEMMDWAAVEGIVYSEEGSSARYSGGTCDRRRDSDPDVSADGKECDSGVERQQKRISDGFRG